MSFIHQRHLDFNSEEEEELYSSSLVNFAKDLEVDDIVYGIRDVVDSAARRGRRISKKASRVCVCVFVWRACVCMHV